MYDLLIVNARAIPISQPGIIENAAVAVQDGKIAAVGSLESLGITEKEIRDSARLVLDAQSSIVMPGLVDCHTHLMENGVYPTQFATGSARKMGIIANLLGALQAGITAVGEHCLGHPELHDNPETYRASSSGLPLTVRLASGMCVIGTNPMVATASTRPGEVLLPADAGPELFREFAFQSDYPGENIFVAATVANLPLEAAPLAGTQAMTLDQVERAVKTFHAAGKKIGAHIEGDDLIQMFVALGGDAVHHGHGIAPETARLLADKNVPLVATIHGGTSRRPTGPDEIVNLVESGVKISIASDSYLYAHPEANWVDEELRGRLLGPRDLMRLCRPVFSALAGRGHKVWDILAMVTKNPADILGVDSGCIEAGRRADLIICRGIPGFDFDDPCQISTVIVGGEVVIQRP